jgi:GTP pyrophosphokinase
VIGPSGKTLEVQIRTHEMHRANELGVAAHWRYKEGGSGDAEFEAKIAWMRKLLEPRGEDDSASWRPDLQTELLEDRVYVLTPKGEVFDLPRVRPCSISPITCIPRSGIAAAAPRSTAASCR